MYNKGNRSLTFVIFNTFYEDNHSWFWTLILEKEKQGERET